MAHSMILPGAYVSLRLPSGSHKICRAGTATAISLGKYGSFNTDSIIGRPYYLTFEIQEASEGSQSQRLRVVPASELHEDSLETGETCSGAHDEDEGVEDSVERIDIVDDAGHYIVRDNRLTIDDASRQTLSFDEIEELKKAEKGSGKDIIAKILQSHSALSEKTAFSLAKYSLRKTKKYLRRFTVLPLDVHRLGQWLLHEKDAPRILEMREEAMSLIASWANLRSWGPADVDAPFKSGGRWLVVDDTSGFLVALIADRLGILYPDETSVDNGALADDADESSDLTGSQKRQQHAQDAMSSPHNSITLLHTAAQPNLSVLAYFSYDPNDSSTNSQGRPHPLHSHLRTLSWLQLLNPELDASYDEPELVSEAELTTWKSAKRGNYHRKRRRWERTRRIIDESRSGGFDGLVIASTMIPHDVLHHTVPLLAGGAQVVVYSPVIQPLVELADAYSSARKSAYINELRDRDRQNVADIPSPEFPLDPRLLLAPTIHTCRATEWQVLPGRTHPLMTSRGGADGYVFTGTRVIPVEGEVQARGNFSKKRRIDSGSTTAPASTRHTTNGDAMQI